MRHYLMPILEKEDMDIYLLLHIGTNNTINSAAQKIRNVSLGWKLFIQEKLEKCEVSISLPLKTHVLIKLY